MKAIWKPEYLDAYTWNGKTYLWQTKHYNGVIIGDIASQITGASVVCSTVCSGTDKRKPQSSASLALCVGNSPVTAELPAQRTINAENVSIWWSHHVRTQILETNSAGLGSSDLRNNYLWIWEKNMIHQRHEKLHYDDVIMTMLASQITSLPVVCSIVYSDVNQRKHQSSASLAFVREIHRGPVNFPHKWPVTRKMFPFDDVIMSNFQTLVMIRITATSVINASLQWRHYVSNQL